MEEPLWMGGPTIANNPFRPRSKRFSRLDQAHAALGIKDGVEEEEKGESEIDKRLGLLGGPKPSPKPSPNTPLLEHHINFSIGSTGSKSVSSTCGASYTSSSDTTCTTNSTYSGNSHTDTGSVYGGVVLRHTGIINKSSSTSSEPPVVVSPPTSLQGDATGQLEPPAKPTRSRSTTLQPTEEQMKTLLLNRAVSQTAAEDKQSKRKRYSSADFLTRSLVRNKENKKGGGSSDQGTDKRKHNRLSTLYNSMRVSKRSSTKQNTGPSDPKPATPDLRLLEETMCQDPKKLLAERVRELRRVDKPEDVQAEREDFPLFEFVCEVSLRRKGENLCPYISWSHPPLGVMENDLLASITMNIPTFCFPDMDIVEPVKKLKTETYCFVFTDLQAQNKFGFCRRFLPASKSNPPEKRYPVVYCMVTKLRSFETFSKIFDQVVELRDFSSAGAYSFLKALIEQNAPKPGQTISVKYINPKVGNLVEINVERVTAGQRFEHVDLGFVLTKLGSKLLVEILINLLVERKLLFVAENLSDLTTIIHSIMQLLYPLQWQGIYIPVLPQEIIDATSSPVPFVIGILKQHSKLMDEEALDDECNLVYIGDKRIVKRPNFTDIPFNKKYRKKFLQELKLYKAKLVKQEPSPSHTAEIGDMFYGFMRQIIGHYADHVTFDETTMESDIDLTSFSDGAGIHSEFVWQLSKTQMFSSFIQGLTPESGNPFTEAAAG